MKKVLVVIIFLAFLGLQLVQAQTRQITGTVTSAADGSTIPGVQVVAVGTTIGTTTDIDGQYSLNVPESATTLKFLFVGMETQEIDIFDRSKINVELSEDLTAVGQVIVLGYSTRAKNQITGSTVQIAGDELKDVPVTSVDQALQGKVAGLVINTSSGTPGSIQEIRIRGIGSILSKDSNDPLIVIDGVPVTQRNISGSTARSSLSSLAAINSNDIESITILKDASATSAYGARGSNGVIVITTRKGKVGQTRFNLNTSYGFQNKAVDGRQELTAAQREELYLEGVYNSFGVANGFTREEAFDYALANNFNEAFTLQRWRLDGRREGDWGGAMINKNAPVLNVNLSTRGGDEKSSFYASFGYTNNEAVVVGNVFERFTGNLNYQRNMGKRVRFSTTNTVSQTNQDRVYLEPSVYWANPNLARYFAPPTYYPWNADGTPATDNPTSYNYLYLVEHDVVWNKMLRIMTNNFLEVDIIEGLKFKTLVGLDFVLGTYKSHQNRNYGDGFQENGTTSSNIDQDFNMVFQNSLDYRLTFLDNHRIDFKALMEFQEYRSYYLSGYGENFSTDGLTNINSTSANWQAGSSFVDWMNLSYLGMINYDYLGKYIADFTYRREGSSRFAADQRFGNFWAVGVAWNMGMENFLAGVSFINNLRLRGSYGVSGTPGDGSIAYQSLLSFGGDYAGEGAVTPSGFGNPSLTWEKNRNYDVGFDFAVLNNRIDGSFAYFNKETYDLLQNVPLTRTSGHSSVTSNVGSMVNKGIEALINIDIIRSNDFNLSIGGNFATLANEVTELAKDGFGNDIAIFNSDNTRGVAVGHPFAEYHMRKWAGVDPANGWPLWYVNGKDDTEGTTSVYSDATAEFQGTSAIPTYSGGTSFHIDFKGVYFDASIYFAGGHSVNERWAQYQWDSGRNATDLYNGVVELMDRWQEPGDITDIPVILHSYIHHENSLASTRFLFDGDFMRAKDLVLGFNLPESILSKIKVGGAQIYVRGTNMFTWVKDEKMKNGYDPEIYDDGRTGFQTPPIKSLIFGLNLNF
ncbi:MAG: SusC/RagA family TonB-linked outer membrane protein [Bacteroidia bacterium]|nr:MAG: SusC/RagA family TonB-linked outer membrane protein [Bacteroidia bacterium]